MLSLIISGPKSRYCGSTVFRASPHRSVVQSLAWKPTETFEYLLVLSGSAFSMNNDKNL